MRVWSTQLNMELMPLFAKAAASTEISDGIAVDALRRRLTGIKSIKFADVAAGDLVGTSRSTRGMKAN